MKKLFSYFLICIFSISLLSCSKDAEEPTSTVGEPIEISINTSVGEPTRATYTEGESGYAFSWSYNDEMSVYNSTSTSSKGSTFATYSTSNSNSATFTGTIDSWSGTTDLYAVYNPLGNYLYSTSIDTSDATVTSKFVNDEFFYSTNISSTTKINNMGFLVGVIEDATTTSIPDVTLNQAMSFLQITFEGISTEDFYKFELSTSSGESLFVTSAKIDITTGEIKEVLSTSSSLNYCSININATNNVWTIPLLPTDMTSTIILSCDLGEYEFSASECNGFFERNTVYSGSINVNDFSEIISVYYYLDDMNSPSYYYDDTAQVSYVYIDASRCSEQPTASEFAGVRSLLNNQDRKTVYLKLYMGLWDVPNNALAGVDTFNELSLSYSSYYTTNAIGNSAFKGCSSLKTVSSGWNNYIDESAFENCTSLQSIDGLDQCTSIGDSAFKNCANLSSLSLNNITYIGDYAFYNCNNIGSIRLGEDNSETKLTYLGTGAFSDDSGSYTEDAELGLYDNNAEYLTGDKTLNVSGQSYTFSTIYLNGAVYVHDSSSSSNDPSVSVDNAKSVYW